MDKEFISDKINELLNDLGLEIINSSDDIDSLTDVYKLNDSDEIFYISISKDTNKAICRECGQSASSLYIDKPCFNCCNSRFEEE